MSKKQTIGIFSNSQGVISSYNEYVQSKGYFPESHKARILIQGGRYNYNQILNISTRIETNYSIISIAGDDEFSRDFYAEYRNDYQVFKLFQNGMIQISDAEDMWGNPITIDISFIEI